MTSHQFPPLESRTMETKQDGPISKTTHPALSPRFSPSPTTPWVEFYLPSLTDHLPRFTSLLSIYTSDLRFLLSLPHHEFWSSMVYCEGIRSQVLASFLRSAPRPYDTGYGKYRGDVTFWGVYEEVWILVFKVYLRMASWKEGRDHITPSFWSNLLRQHKLITLPILQSLCTLYYSENNAIFSKMVDNVVSHDGGMMEELRGQVGLLRGKFGETSTTPDRLHDTLCLLIDAAYSLLNFAQAYPPAAGVLLQCPGFLEGLSLSYESNTRRLAKLPQHQTTLTLLRTALLRLYRFVLITPTLSSVTASSDPALDLYFEYFANSLDEKIFIHDYEKNYPFRLDMQNLLSHGIFVDETRIDYMANAISACFAGCGEEYSVEKIVVDPLYDSNFDRQLLGACSLDLDGGQMAGLVSTVKDLLPELGTCYVEAVLKHYNYKTEDSINALLEGSVPARLEKYKSEQYVQGQWKESVASPVALPGEVFIPNKGSTTTTAPLPLDPSTKSQILSLASLMKEESKDRAKEQSSEYIDASLLPPSFPVEIDYEDEYDDTYDDFGAGMTEPDSQTGSLFKPLNVKLEKEERGFEEEEQSTAGKKTDAFCADPAVARERWERKRAEDWARSHGQQRQHAQQQSSGGGGSRDVVGKAKGQGQDKDVVYNRRQKTANKGGNNKKRADFKRREF